MKTYDSSNTRIFLQGNEDVARWHLPVALSKFNAFVVACKKSGLKQKRFTLLFADTSTTVLGQYSYGECSLQIYSPFKPLYQERSKVDSSETNGPKTFWVSTTKGFFWVEVRYDKDGEAAVILTPFEAIVGEEFVYPGMALTTPGMISGCVSEKRYVLSQNGGVLSGEGEAKGSITSTAIIPSTRITPVDNVSPNQHDFLLIETPKGQTGSIRRIRIYADKTGITVERLYGEINMILAGESEISAAALQSTPCWVHRKCTGSYFSHNKTIGKHVDIGSDDEFFGNLLAIPGGVQDRLDNTGGLPESLYNHTKDLYRLASLFCFPIEVIGNKITIVLVCPTMVFDDDPLASRKWWGGYGLLADQASCADYREDFSRWVLAPHPIKVTIDLDSGKKSYEDFADPYTSSADFSFLYDVRSWDNKFSGSIEISGEYSADTAFYTELGQKEIEGRCSWNEDCPGTCITEYTGTCPRAFIPYQNWARFTRENIVNRRHIVFKPGSSPYSPYSLFETLGYYLLFDGLWHLDVGVLWSHTRYIGDTCYICSSPTAGQEPGQNVTFLIFGVDADWIAARGREYVQNLEVITPLGINTVTWAGSTFEHLSFVAKVPEEYATPHEPVICVGGVQFPSPVVAGETVWCQREIMSQPCTCADNPVRWDNSTVFRLGTFESIWIHDGCPPYTWKITGGGELFTDADATDSLGTRTITALNHLYVQVGDCGGELTVVDACNLEISIAAEITEATIDGPDMLAPGAIGVFELNIGTSAVEYSGGLEFVSQSGGVFELRMPEDACGESFTITLSGCGINGTMEVRSTDGQWVIIYSGSADTAPSFSQSPGTMWVAALGGYVYGESISGRYKAQDRIQTSGGASSGSGSAYMDAGCPGHLELSTNFCTTVVDGIYSGYVITEWCFPTILQGPIWNGNYLVFGYVAGSHVRTIWEWQC